MAVDPNIKKKADDIRNKIYGKEVRESLASGLEEMSSDVVKNEGRQSVVEGRQDSVESQWQNVVDETTDKDVISAPEIIAARNGEANLKTRIDKEHQEVTAQLSQVMLNFHSFGAIGDGVADDTLAIKNALKYAEENDIYRIDALPNKVYKITSPIYNRKSHLRIDFKGSTIEYHGNTSNEYYVDRNIGFFNNIGFIDGLQEMGGVLKFVTGTTNPLNNSQSAKHIISLEKDGSLGKVTGYGLDYFNVGDEVILTGRTREVLPFDSDLFEPTLHVVATVVKKNGGILYIDYAPVFDFLNLVNTSVVQSSIVKVETIKNVTIENFNFVDKVDYAIKGSPTLIERERSVGGVMNFICKNITINNFNAYNYKFNQILNRYSVGVTTNKVSGYRPQLWSAGAGYVIQNVGVRDSNFNYTFGQETRHVLDMTATNHSNVNHLRSIDTHLSDMDLHGVVEHDIYYNDVVGEIGFGNGIQFFPEIHGKVVVTNSNVYLSRDQHSYIEEFIIKDSTLTSRDLFKATKLTMENVKYEMRIMDGGNPYNVRDTGAETFSSLDGVITIVGFSEYNSTRGNVSIQTRGVDNIYISPKTIIKPEFHPKTVGYASPDFFRIFYPKSFICEGTIIDTAFSFYLADQKTDINLNDSKFVTTETYDVNYILGGGRFNNCDLTVTMDSVKYTVNTSSVDEVIVNILQASFSGGSTNLTFDLFINNSIVEGVGNVKVRLYYSLPIDDDDQTFSNSGNVIKQAYTTYPGHQFDIDKNIIK